MSATFTRTGASMRLRVIRKGGRREALAINPQAAQRIRAYLEIAGHGDQLDAPLFQTGNS